jgi:hypothetical protein
MTQQWLSYVNIVPTTISSSTDPALNGHLRYPINLDQSLNDSAVAKLRKYHTDYNPSRGVGFMTTIASTSDRLHSEFIRILFLQTHRETDRFFATSGVMSSPRLTIKLDRLIVLSKSSLLGWFLHVSLIVTIKGRSPMEVSMIVIIKKVSA